LVLLEGVSQPAGRAAKGEESQRRATRQAQDAFHDNETKVKCRALPKALQGFGGDRLRQGQRLRAGRCRAGQGQERPPARVAIRIEVVSKTWHRAVLAKALSHHLPCPDGASHLVEKGRHASRMTAMPPAAEGGQPGDDNLVRRGFGRSGAARHEG
jgi:hypothetical protein